MKTASPALIAFLAANNQFLMADLFVITLVGGYSLYMTTWETALAVDGNTYQPWNIKRSRIRSAVGLEVDTLDVEIYPRTADLINGVPFLAATLRGALDGAALDLYRLFMPAPGDTSLGKLHRFSGNVADCNGDRAGIKIIAKSVLEKLNIQLPRNQFQSACSNTLYDSICGVSKAAWARTGVIISTAMTGSTTSILDDLTLGYIRFDSGPCAGLTRSIRASGGGVHWYAIPLIVPPNPGDAVTAWHGCDKRLETCNNKFANRLNFHGYPFVPTPEAAL